MWRVFCVLVDYKELALLAFLVLESKKLHTFVIQTILLEGGKIDITDHSEQSRFCRRVRPRVRVSRHKMSTYLWSRLYYLRGQQKPTTPAHGSRCGNSEKSLRGLDKWGVATWCRHSSNGPIIWWFAMLEVPHCLLNQLSLVSSDILISKSFEDVKITESSA